MAKNFEVIVISDSPRSPHKGLFDSLQEANDWIAKHAANRPNSIVDGPNDISAEIAAENQKIQDRVDAIDRLKSPPDKPVFTTAELTAIVKDLIKQFE